MPGRDFATNFHEILRDGRAPSAESSPRLERAGSSRLTKDQARGGIGSGGGDRPLRMRTRGDHGAWLAPIAGSRKASTARDGATLAQACTQLTVGAGQGTPPQSSQWPQGGAPIAVRSETGGPDGTAAAATVAKPPARTARQPQKGSEGRESASCGHTSGWSLASPITSPSPPGTRDSAGGAVERPKCPKSKCPHCQLPVGPSVRVLYPCDEEPVPTRSTLNRILSPDVNPVTMAASRTLKVMVMDSMYRRRSACVRS